MKEILNFIIKLMKPLPFVVIPTRYGVFVTPPISPKSQLMGTYEDSMFAVIESVIKPGDVFVDVGANAGYFTLRLGKSLKRTGKVVCFEPNPVNFKYLYFNILFNRLTNVAPYKAAASNFTGKAKLFVPDHAERNSSAESTLDVHRNKKADSVDVSVVTLDSVFERLGVQPRVIKIDVEGAEFDVMKGMLKTLEKGVKLIIVEIHTTVAKTAIFELLNNFDYAVTEIDKFLFLYYRR